MTITYINTGTSANAGDGDSLRTAFTKINANFAEITSNAITQRLMKLSVTTSVPTTATTGTVAVCDGTGWNGGSDGLEHLMVYINGNWTKVI
jgi:hypothetical protein